ncbi:hypothetical protein MferCBS31731_001444 [Microsporum ferrugineum]
MLFGGHFSTASAASVFRAATTTKRAGSRAQHRGNVPIPSVWKIDRKLSTREILSQNKSDRSSK